MHHRLTILTVLVCGSLGAAEWQHPLWLGRGDIWRTRFPVTLTNPTDGALEGVPVALTVGDQPGQAPLAGAQIESVRVTDDQGTQLLYGLRSPGDDALLTTGAVPAGATLTLPAACGPHTAVTYRVYFDNPHAWGLADFWTKRAFSELNGGFEKGAAENPLGWQTAMTSPQHRLAWVAGKGIGGSRALQAEADDGAPKSWFGYIRNDFTLVPGARCTIRVRVRGENVKGDAGWYVHVGDDRNPQRINQTVRTGAGTFDWKEQVITFTVPEGATRMQTGSVLYGTGKAWYDDFTFETDRQPPRATAVAGALERLTLREEGADAPWPQKPGWLARLMSRKGGETEWAYRLPVRVTNLQNESASNILSSIDLNSASRGLVNPRYALTFNGQAVEGCRLGDRLLFSCSIGALTAKTYYLYVAPGLVAPAAAKAAESGLGSDIPSDQILAENMGATDAAAFAKLLRSPANLVSNPDFETGGDQPDGWTHSADAAGATYSLGKPGGFGQRCARLSVAPDARETWRGWYQSVPVKPGRPYLYGAWLACEGLVGSANCNAHMRNAKGAVVAGGFLSAGAPISGDTPWTPMFGIARVPQDATQFQLHLTMNDRGTLKHDGAFLAECIEAETGDPQSQPLAAREVRIWQVDPVIKVFHAPLPPAKSSRAAIALARNETEALQLALRAGRAWPDLRVEVESPKGPRGAAFSDFSVGWVGYVPVDHRTAYYNLTTPEWQLKYPTSTGASDGWSGWWPDPIRPTASGELAPNQTRALWISFKTAADTPAGKYTGRVHLLSGKQAVASVPFDVTVWGFALPARPSCSAIYDLRISQQWLADGTPADEQRDRLMRFMAEKKVNPDEIPASPKFTRDAQGRIVADFTEYDRAAKTFFDELGFRTSYTPHHFYLFGWEHPPKNVMGEKPYDGEYPFGKVDRSRLRQAYKEAYQTCLRLYWDHVKAKGWADKLVLYISDEPFLTKKHIVDQMKACCDMIHEVDPAIRIYSSTWRHCPDWNGYLNIWGAGHYGCFPVSEMEARKAAGEHIWFTTDGQMCTDTPFCAVERLLPHYCFKYGAEAYEFWGISWLTYDPWRFGWHSYIHQSSTPGESYYVRYPNGDGYLLYPGAPVGVKGPVTSVRLEAARDGVEDYDYLLQLQAAAKGGDTEARRLLDAFAALVEIPNAGGRYSSRILPDPTALARLRLQAGALLDRVAPH